MSKKKKGRNVRTYVPVHRWVFTAVYGQILFAQLPQPSNPKNCIIRCSLTKKERPVNVLYDVKVIHHQCFECHHTDTVSSINQ